ncbi:MAG: hypothetical protein RLZZ271_937 [Pseudomonadota bacterium]
MRIQTLSLICSLVAVLSTASAQGIYTCVDAKGRKLTSDRPIADCLDREQRELSTSGRVKRIVPPSLTADERAAEEQKQQAKQEEEMRKAEEKRRLKGLSVKYPNKAAHDKDRAHVLNGIQQAIEMARLRIKQLTADQARLQEESEFYKKDPSKTPATLAQRIRDNQGAITEQRRLIESQLEEHRRLTARFDDEAAKLKDYWNGSQPVNPQPASRAANR